jgi:hypothetical protein
LQMEQLRLAAGQQIHAAGTAMHNNEGERFL